MNTKLAVEVLTVGYPTLSVTPLPTLCIRGICSYISIDGVIRVSISQSVSIFTYKFVCKGTNSRYGHVAGMATTYVTSHVLQPLDVAIFGPLKSRLTTALSHLNEAQLLCIQKAE